MEANQQDVGSDTPLHWAVARLDSEAVASELAGGANPNACAEDAGTPLHCLARAMAKAESDEEDSSVWIAALGDAKAIADALLTVGADPEARFEGKRPCDVQVGGCYMAQRFMFGIGANPNSASQDGSTLLHRCYSEKEVELARDLLAAGANVNALDHRGKTPLHYPKKQTMAELLVEHGADIESEDEDGDTPVFKAVESADPELVVFLASRGANIDRLNRHGDDLFDLQSRNFSGPFESVRLLLMERSSWLRARATPLDFAIAQGDINAVKEHIGNGWDLNAINKHGQLPLAHAVLRVWADDPWAANNLDEVGIGSMESAVGFVRQLIDLGGDPNAPIHPLWGRTPLVSVLSRRFPCGRRCGESVQLRYVAQMVELLLGSGANPNVEADHSLPLESACGSGWEDIAQMLINAGASVQKVVERGNDRNLIRLSKIRGHKRIVQILEQARNHA